MEQGAKEPRQVAQAAANKASFYFVIGPPSPGEVPVRGSDGHFSSTVVGFGPVPARI